MDLLQKKEVRGDSLGSLSLVEKVGYVKREPQLRLWQSSAAKGT